MPRSVSCVGNVRNSLARLVPYITVAWSLPNIPPVLLVVHPRLSLMYMNRMKRHDVTSRRLVSDLSSSTLRPLAALIDSSRGSITSLSVIIIFLYSNKMQSACGVTMLYAVHYSHIR